jgi:hypothetical protein
MDTVAREPGAAELDRLIERRSRKEQDPDEREDLWVESVRIFHERARAERRQQWTEFHRGMALLHGRLAAEHEEKAAKLLDEGRPNETEDAGAA